MAFPDFPSLAPQGVKTLVSGELPYVIREMSPKCSQEFSFGLTQPPDLRTLRKPHRTLPFLASLGYLLIVDMTCPFPSVMSQGGLGHGPRGIA